MTMDPTPGTLFAGYLVERRLGSGGMGTVYVARHPRLPRSVALKILTAVDDSSHMRARFEREADLVAQLDHPNVVEIYDRGVEDDRLWITMRLVEGGDVARMLAPGSPIRPVERAIDLVAQAAAGLDAAHRAGLLHRDVKPANLLLAVDDDGADHVLVTDFGIARSVSGPQLTSTGSVVATLAYASPEQIGAGPLDHRTDVYSLGATLFEMLTGVTPFAGRPPLALLNAQLNEPPPAPRQVDPSLPAGLDEVIATAMAKDPNRRYNSCGALAEAAWRAVRSESSGSFPPGLSPPRSSPSGLVPPGLSPPRSSPLGLVPPGSVPSGLSPQGRSRGYRAGAIALGVTAVALVGVIVVLLGFGPVSFDPAGTRQADGTSTSTATSDAGTSGAAVSTGTTPTTSSGGTDVVSTSLPVSTSPVLPTSTPTAAAAAFPAWGSAAELVALFPDLLPHTPDDVGYQNARCESLDALNNGGMPALKCDGDEGLLWYVWSFRPGDFRRDEMFETNYDNASTREESWQRPSGTGTVRTTDGPSTSGVLTVSFDDPARRWIILDVGSWFYNGRGLFDLWWADAPV